MLETKQQVRMNSKDAADPDIGGCIACGWTILNLPADAVQAVCPNCGEYHCYGHDMMVSTGCLVVKDDPKPKAKVKEDTSPLPLLPVGGEVTSTTSDELSQAVIDAAWSDYEIRLNALFMEGGDADPAEVKKLGEDMDDMVRAETQHRWERAVSDLGDELDASEMFEEYRGNSPLSETQYNGY